MDNSNPLRKTGFTKADFDNEAVLYAVDDETIHCLNATARIIWELCDGTHSVDEMEQALRNAFSVPPDRDVRADILRTLNTLAAKGLLEQVPHAE